jgi:hypothetical protein
MNDGHTDVRRLAMGDAVRVRKGASVFNGRIGIVVTVPGAEVRVRFPRTVADSPRQHLVKSFRHDELERVGRRS